MYKAVVFDKEPLDERLPWISPSIHTPFENETLGQGYDMAADNCDTFLYLADRYKVLESCTDDILTYLQEENKENWMTDKMFVNYLSAFAGYKEYVRSLQEGNDNPYCKLTGKYYFANSWFRLVCDIRNYAIHYTLLSKDYTKDDAFICIDDLSSFLIGRKDSSPKLKTQKEHFLKALANVCDDACIIVDTKRYLRIGHLIRHARLEVQQLRHEVMLQALNDYWKPGINWFIDRIVTIDGEQKFTFYRNEETSDLLCISFAVSESIRFVMKSLSPPAHFVRK